MNAATDHTDHDLASALSRAHDEADRLLADPEGNRLEVVTWLSGHIAAFEHAVYPTVRHRVSDGAALVDADREVVAMLARSLRMLERRHSGDVLARGLSSEHLSNRVVELVKEHRAVQRRILDALDAALDDAEATDLVREYDDALSHAPTRPHPHLHAGLLFRLEAVWDRLLDTMDGRHVPLPRVVRPHINPGRWGSYLLGQQQGPQDPR